MRHVPVVVVGGGPVGMVLAMSLAGFNVRTMLVNTESSTRWFPKDRHTTRAPWSTIGASVLLANCASLASPQITRLTSASSRP